MTYNAILRALACKLRTQSYWVTGSSDDDGAGAVAVQQALDLMSDACEELANMTEQEIEAFLAHEETRKNGR